MTQKEYDFHCMEWQQLHKEMDEIIKSMRDVIKYIFVFLGATYAFLFSRIDNAATCVPQNLKAATFIPVLLVALSIAGVVFWAFQMSIIRSYLERLEMELAKSDFGWEQHFKSKPKPQQRASWIIWVLLVLGTIGMSLAIFPPVC
ncbi:hypothetical protein OKA06_13140 [Novosphingobium sp. MW5]|nr:hypothetical protein [Novosphingobium sp. MW5]